MSRTRGRGTRAIAAIAAIGALACVGGSGAATVAVEVRVIGSGIVRSVPPGVIECGRRCTAMVEAGSTLVLEADPDTLNQLTAWGGPCVGKARLCELTVEGATVVTARFDRGLPTFPEAHDLGVTRSGPGAVTSDPAGVIACGTLCATGFSGGGAVQLRAAASPGATFVGWGGSCAGTANCNLVLTADRFVTAPFRPARIQPIAVFLTVRNVTEPPVSEPIPLRITTTSGTSECTTTVCTRVVTGGSTVEIAGDNPRVWSGDCVGEGPRCVIVISGPSAVTGTLILTEHANTFIGVNVSKSGSGRVTSKPSGIDCGPLVSCSASFKRNIGVELTATPDERSRFVRWLGDCTVVVAATCSMTVNTIKSATAVFRLVRDQLRIERRGDGAGSVTSEPAGIDCGAACRAEFLRGTPLTLRAHISAGSRFMGWNGPCTGTGPCTFTIRQPTDVEAAFRRRCAARELTNFAVEAKRSPRRLLLRVRLDSQARVRIRLLRRGRTIVERPVGAVAEGQRTLALAVPRGVRAGRARVQLRVTDICGGFKALSRPVRVR